jgi:hypothetical protein
MSFQLDSDVAIPSQRNRYPFGDMTSGQSFAIEGEERARAVRNASYQHAKKANATRLAKIDAAVKEATDLGASAEEIAQVRAEATASVGPEVSFTLRQVRVDDTGVQAKDEAGNPLTDKDGNPVNVLVKHYRLWRE